MNGFNFQRIGFFFIQAIILQFLLNKKFQTKKQYNKMQPSNNKIDSQSRSQNQRKYQYFTGTSATTNPNLTASSIDQHRNSIEQRIANLQSKLAKKFTPQLQSIVVPQTQSDNYVNTRRMYQYSGTGSQQQHQKSIRMPVSQPRLEVAVSNVRQISSTQGKSTYKYLNNQQQQINDEEALKEKYKFSSHANNQNPTHYAASRQPGAKLKSILQKSSTRIESNIPQKHHPSSKDRAVGKKIKNIVDNKNENRKPSQVVKPYQSNQQFKRKYPLSVNQTPYRQTSKKGQSIPRQNPILNTRYLQDNFNQLNTNISNLKNFTAINGTSSNYPFENYRSHLPSQSRTISYDIAGVNVSQISNAKNNDLYEMMKSIMVGQERLEKELIMLKNNRLNGEEDKFNQSRLRNQDSIQPYMKKTNMKDSHTGIKNSNIPESRLMSPIRQQTEHKNSHTKPHTVHNTQSRSPQPPTKKSKSPRPSKSPRQPSRSPAHDKSGHQTRQTSAIKRKRVNSAVNGKKVAGKIQKNKERFYELYKQAQTNKRLNQSNTRITISNDAVSSVWQKIKQSITRAESQDVETSVIYHENNRSVNDHLVSKIELQKKLKNDLVKKVYDMCENKCLFK